MRCQALEKIMSRISPVVPTNTETKVAATPSPIKASLSRVPNVFVASASAPVALEGYLSLSKALSRGRLTVRQREILALAIAQENECQSCLSAHTALSEAVGLCAVGALKARFGKSDDPLERALTSFTKNVASFLMKDESRWRYRLSAEA
jgi:AhpD family alkylhydroperoxidase